MMTKLIASIIAAVGTGCATGGACEPLLMSPAEFQNAIHSDTTAIVLDVRKPDEFSAGHIGGAVNIDYLDSDKFEKAINELSHDKTYYVYCRSGRRSAEATKQMSKLSLCSVDLEGGILNWEAQGFPVEH